MAEQIDCLFFEALKRADITIDIEADQRARFRKIILEHEGKMMTWFYNDGTPGGKKILTIIFPDYMCIRGGEGKIEHYGAAKVIFGENE